MVDMKKKIISRRRAQLINLSIFILLLFAAVLSLDLGRFHVPGPRIVRILLTALLHGNTWNSPSFGYEEWIIIMVVRLPRVITVILAGMGLALSGAAMQGLFRNPLVGPQIVGVSSGASFGGVLAIFLSLPAFGIVGMAFCFGVLSLLVVFGLARLAGRAGILSLVLAGVIVSTFFSALVGIVQFIADPEQELPGMVYWLMGSFASADWKNTVIIGIPTLIAGSILLFLRWRINLLSLGDTDAEALGCNVKGLRYGVVGLVSLIVAAQVSVSGGVGWVGLVIPHFARMMVGPDHRVLLPGAALLGGVYLLIMDSLARNLTSLELPIGLLTALIGTPVFAVVFWRTQARGWVRD